MKSVKGFTIIELLMVVVILGILLTIAVPSFRDLMIRSRIASAANELTTDLALARSEALRRGGATIVTVCASSNGTSCAAGTDWSVGRIVYVDGGTVGTVDSGDVILRKSDAVSGVTLGSSGFSANGYVAYSSSGAITSTVAGSITLCVSGFVGRVLTVSNIGRVSIANTSANCS